MREVCTPYGSATTVAGVTYGRGLSVLQLPIVHFLY